MGDTVELGQAIMRWFFTAAACVVVFGLLAGPASAQIGFDRKGGDYASFLVRSGDPAVCAARCERDARCRAWSFTYPGKSHGAICWLKSQVPARTADSCCASGVKGAGVTVPRDASNEVGIDRTGGDYRSLDVPADPSGHVCKAACEADNRCRAWTYVRPGYHGPNARCFLKERVRPPRHKPCCISGVVK
jgi:hypothetical protein